MLNWIKRSFQGSAKKSGGAVDEYTESQVSGWITGTASRASSHKVGLFINEQLVASRTIESGLGDKQRFSFGMYDVWRFAKKADLISVRKDGTPLRLPNGRFNEHPRRDGKESLDELIVRFNKGHSFDKKGRIVRQPKNLDHSWQEGVLGLYEEVAQVIEQVTGANSFIYSGTLLGYVRDNENCQAVWSH